MTAPLVQRLSLVVDATTGDTETRMDAVASAARQAGETAERSAGQVAAAAERVAAAQLKRDDATDRVTLAERRLLEVQERYQAGSSQVLAAEQRLESSRRQLAIATRQLDAAQAESMAVQGRAVEATARAATETERARVGAERFGGQLESVKGLAQGVAAFALGDWLRDQTTEYLDAARGAQTLASSMNATVEQGGRLSVLFGTMGLDAADLLEIQAEFAQKAGAQGEALESFGASLQTNRDGTINWASTLEDALVQLQKIPDATERNRLGFQLFGEEGYKQLSRLLTSGVSVEDALARIGTPITTEDVRIAQNFDRQMTQLSLSSSELGRALVSNALPAVTGLVEGLGDVVGVVTQVPLPLTVATAAAIAMGRTGFDPLARGSEFVSEKFTALRDSIGNAAGGVEEGAGRMARAAGVARAGVGGLVDLLGGPLGVAAIGAGLAYSLAAAGQRELEDSAREAAAEIARLGGTSNDQAVNSRRLAQQLEDEAGSWERLMAAQRGLSEQREELSGYQRGLAELGSAFGASGMAATQVFTDEEGAARGFSEAIEDAREELGELGAQQEVTAQTSRSLTDMIAQGTTSGREFGDAVREAAEAEAAQAATSDTASAAIDAYRNVTDQAVTATRNLIDARYATEDAEFAFRSAMDASATATDDSSTSLDEARQAQVRLMEAALRAGDTVADAAVAQARAAGQIVTPLEEANIRADALITDLQARLDTPGLTESARGEMQGLIDQLTEARDKGDVNALVTLTGADTAASELDEATADRESHVNVESRGGPAVDAYLDSLTEDRLALIRTESRGGPDVRDYLGSLAADRLAIIRVETRGGPDVDTYLDNLASNYGRGRTAVIDVQTRGTGAGGGGPTGAGMFGAAPVSIGQLIVQPQVDSGGRLTAAGQQVTGRAVVAAIRDYERQNGTGWRR